MKNTKIYNVLLHFNKYEQNKLRKFMLSPYFNSDKSVIDLFDLVTKYINGSRKKELLKEKLWEKLSGKKDYDDVRFRKYCSSLLKVVESFLAYDYVEKEKVTKTYLLLEAVKKRKIKNLYDNYINASKKIISNVEDKSANGHLNKYLVEKSLYDLTDSELKRMDKSNLETISNNLDNLYFTEKLKFYTSALYQQRVTDKSYKIRLANELIDLIDKEDLTNTPSIAVYYYMYLTIKFPEKSDYYFNLKELLTKHAENFPRKEALNLYYSLTNYCIKKVNSGKFDFYEELYLVYKEMVNRKIVLGESEEISPWDFKNIVTAGLFLEDLSWTETFIEDFGDYLSIKYRDNSVRFNKGQLYFRQKRYDDTLIQLRDLEYEDTLASLNAKTITTMTYFEMDSIDALFSYIESFRVYLGRKEKSKELAKERQQRYIRFLNLVKKLTRVIPRDKKGIEKIGIDLQKSKDEGLVGAKWLTEKIEELKHPSARRV